MRHEKLSPGLISALVGFARYGAPGLSVRARSLGLKNIENQKEPMAIVFLRTDPDESFENLPSVRVNQKTGEIRTAAVPLSAIDELSERPAVRRITMSRNLRPRLDMALQRIRIPQFRTSSGANGRDVVVGVVDSGMDPNHPDFHDRINRIWDQTIPGPGVPEGGYGLELIGAAITASRDTVGHGTHVTGIAAGADATFTGVAPSATLVGVKTDFNDAHIADGVRYVFRVADQLKVPAVVNLSLGGHMDPHDGTDDLSAVIDAVSGAGHIVCCAAGNEGEDNIHAQIKIAAGQVARIRFQVPAGAPLVFLNGWYSGADEIEVAVQPPQGTQTPFQGSVAAGNPHNTFASGAASINLTTPGPNPLNGDHQIYIELSANGGQLPGGAWTLLLRGRAVTNGVVDFWTSDAEAGSSILFHSDISGGMKIGSPGSSSKAITVGSFTNRIKWPDATGLPEEVGFPDDTLSPFSSPGPLRNKTNKPDVTAPGAMIISALSADSHVDAAFKASASFRVDAGTSMATPVIAGMVALLLQGDPTLTPDRVKERLRQASTIPNQPPGTFDVHWGFGLLDASNL
jgi:subtilisin family serine protease